MSDWPELGEELARKSFDYLHQKMVAHEAGELSKSDLYHVADTLADVTQGLIDKSDWRVIYAVRQELLR